MAGGLQQAIALVLQTMERYGLAPMEAVHRESARIDGMLSPEEIRLARDVGIARLVNDHLGVEREAAASEPRSGKVIASPYLGVRTLNREALLDALARLQFMGADTFKNFLEFTIPDFEVMIRQAEGQIQGWTAKKEFAIVGRNLLEQHNARTVRDLPREAMETLLKEYKE